jgi:hypothetical protein
MICRCLNCLFVLCNWQTLSLILLAAYYKILSDFPFVAVGSYQVGALLLYVGSYQVGALLLYQETG